jgi:hypothetical protein
MTQSRKTKDSVPKAERQILRQKAVIQKQIDKCLLRVKALEAKLEAVAVLPTSPPEGPPPPPPPT